MTKPRTLTLDPTAKSADPSKPTFLARPAGSPVYHGFVVLPMLQAAHGRVTAVDGR